MKRDGDKPYAKRDGDRKPYAPRDGERKPYVKRDGDRKPYAPRDGERKPYVKRDGDKPYAKRDGDRKPYAPRDGERKPYVKRDGDRPYAPRDGERKPYVKRDGDRPYAPRDGERKPYVKRDGDKPYAKRDGDRKPYAPRDGDRKPYQKRDGDRSYAPRDGERRSYPTRGGADRPARDPREIDTRSVRPRHDEPEVPEEITPQDLHSSARNELKTLSKENADWVARHLAMAAQLIDEDPERAHAHAIAATRRAGRIAIVRETAAITAYGIGDYALALRELRTYRRISGRDDQIALMVDSERGVGRADRALEVGRAVDRASLPTSVRVELAIAMSGARLDLGETERALLELDIPELDPNNAFEWSPALFAARAAVLEELGRADEAAEWNRRALVAADALDAAAGLADTEVVFVESIEDEFDDSDVDDSAHDASEEADAAVEADPSDEDVAPADVVPGDDTAADDASGDDDAEAPVEDER
ncbi:hypothetical protein GCM10009778_29260 [Microbacterium terricola]